MGYGGGITHYPEPKTQRAEEDSSDTPARHIQGDHPHGWHFSEGPPIRRAEGDCEDESSDSGDGGSASSDVGAATSVGDPLAGVPVVGGLVGSVPVVGGLVGSVLGGLKKRQGPLERLVGDTGVAAPAGSVLDSVPFLGALLGRAMGVLESGISSPEVDGGRGMPDRVG